MLEYRYIVPALLGMSSERTKCHYDVTSCSPSSEWKGRERKREGRGSGEGGGRGKGGRRKVTTLTLYHAPSVCLYVIDKPQ